MEMVVTHPEGILQVPEMEHIYRYTLRSPRVFLGYIIAYPLALVIIFIINVLFPPHHFGFDPFVTISYVVGMSIGLALTVARTTLTITPEGVLYRRPGRSTWAVWSDIEALRPWSRGYYGWTAGEGLVIRSDAFSPLGARRGGLFSRYFIPLFSRYFIPLECFAPRWRESPLGEDVRRCAPWLFTEANSIHR